MAAMTAMALQVAGRRHGGGEVGGNREDGDEGGDEGRDSGAIAFGAVGGGGAAAAAPLPAARQTAVASKRA